MKINTRTLQTPIKLDVKKKGTDEKKLEQQDSVKVSPHDEIDAKNDEYNEKINKLKEGEKFRKIAIMGGSIAIGTALGVAGGLVTGIGGAVIGGVTGFLGGITAGALGGSGYADLVHPHAGSGALAYLGIGMVGGAIAGAVGGAFAGFGTSAVIGGVAGVLGGAFIGHTLHYSNEYRLLNKVDKEVFG